MLQLTDRMAQHYKASFSAFVLAAVCALASLVLARTTCAQPNESTQEKPQNGEITAEQQASIETARKSLKQGWAGSSAPWYDPAKDDVRQIVLPPPPKTPPPAKTNNANFDFLPTFLEVLGWLVLAALLIGLAYLLFQVYLNRDRRNLAQQADEVAEPEISQADRVEALPFRIQRQTTDLLGEARRCYEAGHYDEAIIYLFSHQLVELDRHQLIRLAKGKTNRQCVREIAPRQALMRLVEQTMVAFEDVFFGNHPLERLRFEACWLQLETFQRLLQEVRR